MSDVPRALPRGGHFDEMTAMLFLEDQLNAERSREVSDHLHSCSACRQLLRALQNENTWLAQAMIADEPLPARLAYPSRGVANHWGWLAAACVALGGAYTFWSGVISPWLDQASQAGFSQGNLLTMLLFTGAFWKGWDAMLTTMEFSAAAVLTVGFIWLVSGHLRRAASIGVVLGALAIMLTFSPVAGATEIAHGRPNFILPSGQQSNRDLIVTANYTRIDGDVTGDLIAFSNSVTVNGHVKGDVIVFAQELRMNGTVDGNLRGFCHSLVINGTVAKNVSSWSQNLDLDNKAQVGGSIILGANDAELDGRIGSDVLAFAHSIDLDGPLGGDARVWGESLSIGSEADVKGHVAYTGQNAPDVMSGAKTSSPVETVIRRRGINRPNYASARFYWRELLFWGVLFVLGFVLSLVAPGFFADATSTSKRIGPAIGFGAIALIGVPLAVFVACVTIVGLGIGIVTLLLYLIALFASQIFVGEWIAEKLLGSAAGAAPVAGRLALGLAIIRVLGIIPILGGLVRFVAILWGLGAIVLTLYRRMQPRPTVPAVA